MSGWPSRARRAITRMRSQRPQRRRGRGAQRAHNGRPSASRPATGLITLQVWHGWAVWRRRQLGQRAPCAVQARTRSVRPQAAQHGAGNVVDPAAAERGDQAGDRPRRTDMQDIDAMGGDRLRQAVQRPCVAHRGVEGGGDLLDVQGRIGGDDRCQQSLTAAGGARRRTLPTGMPLRARRPPTAACHSPEIRARSGLGRSAAAGSRRVGPPR
jgi:hypothetical protein